MSTLPANAPAPAAPKAMTPADEIRNRLMSEDVKKELVMALPPQMPVERFQRVAITAINNNPDIALCERASIYNAFMRAAQDGLLPDGREAAIVKFNSKNGPPKAQYMPMVFGILKKVRNSGELKSMVSECIHKNDTFARWIDERGEHMRHEPLTFGDRGEIIGVYALAMTKDEGIYIEVMTKAQVEEVRAVSRAAHDGPWVKWWDQMAKKTAIRRLSKRLPMSSDLDDLIRQDDELYDLNQPKGEGETKGEPGKPGRLKKLLSPPRKMIEGEAREVTDAPEASEPLITPDNDPAPAEEAPPAPAPAPEQGGALQCAKCTFSTDDPQAASDHAAAAHGIKPAQATRPSTTPAQQNKKPAGPGGLFGQ